MNIKKIEEGIKYWSQLLLLPVYGFSFLVPRDKSLWLFGSTFGRRFADNPRYFYLYVRQNCPQIRAIWISHNQDIVEFLRKNGYEAYYYHSMHGIFYALRAGIYIFDNYSKDINFWQSGGAVKINLWHGSGNKRTNHDNLFDKVRHPKNAWERWKAFPRVLSDEKPNHYTLATSPAMCDIFVSAFQTDKSHIIMEGYPRNDMLFSHEESCIQNLLTKQEREFYDGIEYWRKKGYRVLAYIPTFRDSEKKFFDVMEMDVFNQFLKNEQLIFITKMHPKSKLDQEFRKICCSNIIHADAEIDVYSFLKMVDLLITDYSSVYTDYMLLDRPVIAFQYDRQEYCADTRECYIEQDEYMPELKAVTMEELIRGIQSILMEDRCRVRRHISRRRMFAHTDGRSSQRLFQKIGDISNNKGVAG
ncbi:MAG: CDP-glycerol glycerophosphotransferase family protein [Lachnospiraceae bacterium]